MPRDLNQHADALTNLNFEEYDPAKRRDAVIDSEAFPVLFSMLKQGKDLFEAVQSLKDAQKGMPKKWPKVAKYKRLRHTDPW